MKRMAVTNMFGRPMFKEELLKGFMILVILFSIIVFASPLYIKPAHADTNSFGYTTVAATATSVRDVIYGSNFTFTGTTGSTANTISVVLASTAGNNGTSPHHIYATAALYNTTYPNTHTLLAQTAQRDLGTASKAWQTFTFSSPPSLSNGKFYTLEIWGDSKDKVGAEENGVINAYYDVGNQIFTKALAYTGTYPSPVTDFSGDLRVCSIYCNYTVPNATPTISARTYGWDDTNNCYARKQYYQVHVNYSDTNGYGDIHYCELAVRTSAGGTVRARFRYHEDDNTASIITGSTAWDFLANTAYFTRAGNNIAAIWSFTAFWNATEESGLACEFYVVDASAASANTTDASEFDVVTRLVTSGFTSDDNRTNVGATITLSGTVYYGDNPASNTASTSYPPNSDFTSVIIHDSAHATQATDTTIVHGAFSVSFAIPSTVQSNTYHVYLNMAQADYTDADAVDGDTTSVIGDRIQILTLGVADGRININADGLFYATAQLEYTTGGTHSLGSGDSLTLSSCAFAWNASSSRFEYSVTQSSVTSVTINTFTSGTEATYSITAGNINSKTNTTIWDRLQVQSYTVADSYVNINDNVNIDSLVWFDFDDTVCTTATITINGYSATHQGSGVYRITRTSAIAASVTYGTVACSAESTYGITTVDQNSKSQKVIWENVVVSDKGRTDDVTNVNEYEQYWFTLRGELNSTAVSTGTVTLNGSLPASWVSVRSRWEYNTTKSSAQELSLYVFSLSWNSITSLSSQTSNFTSIIWDGLSMYSLQPVEYLGGANFSYAARIKYSYSSSPINGANVNLTLPTGTVISQFTSNSTGWMSFILTQTNATLSGTYTLFGVNDNNYGITYAVANQTFTLKNCTLNSQDTDGNTLTATTVTLKVGSTTVYSSNDATLRMPETDYNVSIVWNTLTLNTTTNFAVSGDTVGNFTCLAYPYTYSGTRYWIASNATIDTALWASDILTINFTSPAGTYILKASCTTQPVYILNCTYDFAIDWTTLLTLTHHSNTTISIAYANWGGVYVQSVDQRLTSASWAGQKLTLNYTASSGATGNVEVYCGSRGMPVEADGFTTTSYSSSTTVLSGSFTFASDVSTYLLWVPTGGGPGGGVGGGQTVISNFLVSVMATFNPRVLVGTEVNGTLSIEWTGPSTVYIYDITFEDNSWFTVNQGLPLKVERTSADKGSYILTVKLNVPKDAAPGSYEIPCNVLFKTEGGQEVKAGTVVLFTLQGETFSLPSYMVYVFLGLIGTVVLVGSIRKPKP